MATSSIQYHIKRRLQGNVKLHQPIVASTASCTLYRFTRLKSSVLVGFSALPWQSGDVVALYRGNVAAWWCGSVLKRLLGSIAASGRRRAWVYTRGRAGSCELEAASCITQT